MEWAQVLWLPYLPPLSSDLSSFLTQRGFKTQNDPGNLKLSTVWFHTLTWCGPKPRDSTRYLNPPANLLGSLTLGSTERLLYFVLVLLTTEMFSNRPWMGLKFRGTLRLRLRFDCLWDFSFSAGKNSKLIKRLHQCFYEYFIWHV